MYYILDGISDNLFFLTKNISEANAQAFIGYEF